MSKVKELLKKTPLRPLCWELRKIPPVKALRKFAGEKRRDKLLFRILPEAYNAHRNDPMDERKVIFVELRYNKLMNSMEELYRRLKEEYDYDIHLHLINNGSISRKEYRKRCRKLVADMATAKYVFLSDASEAVSCVDLRPETVVTQLWHACGAFKKFGLSTADLLFGFDRKQQERHPMYRNLTYVAVSSPEIIWAYAEAMNLKGQEEKIKPVGTSRTDVFFRSETIETAFEHLYKKFPAARGRKVILYAPTFRGRVARAKTPDCFDLEAFYQALGEDYVVIMKHHPLVRELPPIPEKLQGTFAYDATKTMSIEDLLCVSDICISDYSSVIFEYSLFERPMLFYAYDLEEYFDWRGFYYPYDELTPGPVCQTNEEMIDYILHLEERFDKQEVIDFKNKFMSACDGHATERIINLVFGKNAKSF